MVTYNDLEPWAQDALGGLTNSAAEIAELEDFIRDGVILLRKGGVPWSMIGTALGITAQGAHQRYGH